MDALHRVIAALSVVFETTEDDRVLRRALEGLHDFAKVFFTSFTLQPRVE